MHGIGEFALSQWGTFFVTSFVIELVINRHPWVVAIAVPVMGFAAFALRAGEGPISDVVAVFGTIALIGILPSVLGAGLARYIRLWIELNRADRADGNFD